MLLTNFNYLCFVGGLRQQIAYSLKSFSSFSHSGSSGMVFLLPVLSGFLPSSIQINYEKQSTLKLPYTLATSASNDLTVSTVRPRRSNFIRLITHLRDMQERKGLGREKSI